MSLQHERFTIDRFDEENKFIFQCPICQDLANTAVSFNCGHPLCGTCAVGISRCPMCRIVGKTNPVPFVDRQIRRLTCHCIFEPRGCTQIGTMDEMDLHAKLCDLRDCIHCGQLAHNLIMVCGPFWHQYSWPISLFQTRCDICEEDVATCKHVCEKCGDCGKFVSNLKLHIEQCESVLVDCPDCPQKCARGELAEHQSNISHRYILEVCRNFFFRKGLIYHLWLRIESSNQTKHYRNTSAS